MKDAIRVEDLLAMAVIISGRYLLNVDQVRYALGDMPDRQVDRLLNKKVITVGKSRYYKPEDVWEARQELNYGKQAA